MAQKTEVNYSLDRLYEASLPVIEEDSRKHRYLYNAYVNNLTNYRLITPSVITRVGMQIFPRYVNQFLMEQEEVIGIFNKLNDEFIYVILRATREKKFIMYGLRPYIPYGVNDLRVRYGQPIMITEGAYDRDSIIDMFPNTVALLTSYLTQTAEDVLLSLTNYIVLCLDNDETGRKSSLKISMELRKSNIYVAQLNLCNDFKDLGEIADLRFKGQDMKYKAQREHIRGCMKVQRLIC